MNTTNKFELMNKVLKSDDWLTRRRAIVALSHMKDQELYEVFTHALSDPVDDVRHAAIIAISRLGEKKAVNELVKPKFLRSNDLNIRWATIRALGELADYNIIDELFDLVDDEEWLVRNETLVVLRQKVESIVEKGDPALARILISMLSLKDQGIVQIALQGLVKMEPACKDILIDALGNVRANVRWNVAVILGQSKEKSAVRPLISALSDHHPLVREKAAHALGVIGDTRAIPHLIEGLSDRNRETRNAIVEALVQYGNKVLEPLHSELAHTQNPTITCAIIQALGKLSSPSSIDLLISHLSSSFFTVRNEAVIALKKYGNQIINPLVDILSENTSDIKKLLETAKHANGIPNRLRAIKALGDLEDHRAAPLLKELLAEDNTEIAVAAEEALVQVGCSAWGRCGALTVLGSIGDASLVPKLMRSLKDDSPHVRFEAIRAIGNLDGKPALEQLHHMAIKDPVSEVRVESLKVLREEESNSDKLLNTSLKSVDDDESTVRLEAVRILGDLVDPKGLEPLIKALSDPVWSVRISSENALCNYGEQISDRLLGLLDLKKPEALYRVISAIGRLSVKNAISALEEILATNDHPKIQSITKQTLMLLKGETGRKVK